MIRTVFAPDAGVTGRRSPTGSFIPTRKSLMCIKRLPCAEKEFPACKTMDENEQLAGLINKDLGDPDEGMMIPLTGLDRHCIREQLSLRIAYLIEHNFEKLCQAMYRLDVSEAKFHQVLNEKPVGEVPEALADLVIEREIQKIRTRVMYKKGLI